MKNKAVLVVFIFVLILTIIIGVVYFSLPKTQQTQNSNEIQENQLIGQTIFSVSTEDNTYTSEEGRFSVMIPGDPVKETQFIKTPIGTIPMYFVSSSDDNLFYGVGYADYPIDLIEYSNSEDILDGSSAGGY